MTKHSYLSQFTPTAGEGARGVGLIKRMDDANVKYSMVSGMPFVKNGPKIHYTFKILLVLV